MRAGDVLVFFVDPQRPLRDQNELVQFTQAHPGWKIEWRVQRGTQLSDPIVVQIPQPLDPKDATLGLNLETPLIEAPVKAAQEMWTVVASIPRMFGQVFAGTAPPMRSSDRSAFIKSPAKSLSAADSSPYWNCSGY